MGAFVCSEDVSDRGATGLAPLKLFESLASGIPVIVTDMPFQADVVHDGNCGYVVPQRDSACLAQTVAKLATDKVQAQTMGENARLIAVEEHSWKARARATHETLLKVL
jgi:glycosyltransferase involved in cell wall biosynthesis